MDDRFGTDSRGGGFGGGSRDLPPLRDDPFGSRPLGSGLDRGREPSRFDGPSSSGYDRPGFGAPAGPAGPEGPSGFGSGGGFGRRSPSTGLDSVGGGGDRSRLEPIDGRGWGSSRDSGTDRRSSGADRRGSASDRFGEDRFGSGSERRDSGTERRSSAGRGWATGSDQDDRFVEEPRRRSTHTSGDDRLVHSRDPSPRPTFSDDRPRSPYREDRTLEFGREPAPISYAPAPAPAPLSAPAPAPAPASDIGLPPRVDPPRSDIPPLMPSAEPPIPRGPTAVDVKPPTRGAAGLTPDFRKSELNVKRRAERGLAEQQPEVHIIGEIAGGSEFGSGVACKYAFEVGNRWDFADGAQSGQTHTDYPGDKDMPVVWAHPIDVHYYTRSLHGWPRILVQVWGLDSHGRSDLKGYGFIHVPAAAGSFELDIPTWRPVGTGREEMKSYFLGGTPALKSTGVIVTNASQRWRLTTVASGTVHIRLDVILKNFGVQGVEWM